MAPLIKSVFTAIQSVNTLSDCEAVCRIAKVLCKRQMSCKGLFAGVLNGNVSPLTLTRAGDKHGRAVQTQSARQTMLLKRGDKPNMEIDA
ncbi:hypothetical protein FPY71_14095 [Aureimonas fodinaquatilis]|uniref:Uncharacterized protein n=1 Tax=Aureimonas fodinaquatilis TaxID=2565783 RepID=A0A5B0DVQ5_9HYPH|nr:hypothetical protein [Aureimonas fodinaquatilis]KAA0969650.1 hypothetical protein FPY71_14095 [Aureimonas fodinaquatilis]